jgi:hypothetical protein
MLKSFIEGDHAMSASFVHALTGCTKRHPLLYLQSNIEIFTTLAVRVTITDTWLKVYYNLRNIKAEALERN